MTLYAEELKQMAEKLPERRSPSPIPGPVTKPVSNVQYISRSQSHSSSENSDEIESNGNAADHRMLPYRAKTQTDKPQWVVQAEPGVYITLCALPSGGNELKRIRFRNGFISDLHLSPYFIVVASDYLRTDLNMNHYTSTGPVEILVGNISQNNKLRSDGQKMGPGYVSGTI